MLSTPRSMLVLAVCAFIPGAYASSVSVTGDLRTDASFTACGSGCTLGAANSDSDYAQWAAVSVGFSVPVASVLSAITFSYGGGTNGAGHAIAQSGCELRTRTRSLKFGCRKVG